MQKIVRFLSLLISNLVFAGNIAWCSCNVAATNMNFGNYIPSGISPTTTMANINVTCTLLSLGIINYVVFLSKGNSNNYALRQMKSGSSGLNYNIYTDSGYVQIWGDRTSGTYAPGNRVQLLQFSTSYTAYGLIPASQNVSAGTYTDTIVVTVNF